MAKKRTKATTRKKTVSNRNAVADKRDSHGRFTKGNTVGRCTRKHFTERKQLGAWIVSKFGETLNNEDVEGTLAKWFHEDPASFFKVLRTYLPSDLVELLDKGTTIQDSVREIFRLMTGGLPAPGPIRSAT